MGLIGEIFQNRAEIDFESFKEWLSKTHCDSTVKAIMRYAQRYWHVLFSPNEASKIAVMPKDMRRNVMASLANLSRFLGMYEQWKAIVKTYGLKWEKRNGLEVLLSILNTNIEEVREWLKEAIVRLPKKYAVALIFNALTGLRPREGINACNLIVELSEQNRLNEYLDKDLMMLQHFRFPKIFLRKSKNAYISFITPELLNLVLKYKPRIKYKGLHSALRKLKMKNKTKQLRKLFATTLREYLPQESIDLLQGRIGQNIFVRFYYKPTLAKLREQTLKGIEPLQKELIELFNKK